MLKIKKPITQIIHENELLDINIYTHKCVNIFNNYFITVGEKIANQIQNDSTMKIEVGNSKNLKK